MRGALTFEKKSWSKIKAKFEEEKKQKNKNKPVWGAHALKENVGLGAPVASPVSDSG